jgi:hypothetical protein
MGLPELPLDAWVPTKETLHLWTQIVGKARLAAAWPRNHWWHVTLSPEPRGLTARGLVFRELEYDISFDFVAHELVVRTSRGDTASFALLDGLSVAAFYEQLGDVLDGLGIELAITAEPYRTDVSTIPFAKDTAHATYDREAVERFYRALLWSASTLQEHAGWFSGKTSPVNFFWHGFDLAVARFSGARAPDNPDADPVSREAYSHEVISSGFWPGDRKTGFPAFYSYTAPEPEGLAAEPLLPESAYWQESASGSSHLAMLAYDDVRNSHDPRGTLLSFLESAYDAGARLAGWDREGFRSYWAPRSR